MITDQLLLREATIDDLQRKLSKKSSRCSRFGDYYRRNFKSRSDWDICERCTVRDTRYITIHQSYKKMIRNKSDFKKAQKAILDGEPMADPLVPKVYAQHGQPGLLGRLFSRKQVDLGEPLDENEWDDRDYQSSDEDISEDLFSSSEE